MKAKLELKKVRDFGEIINDSFVFAGQNWKPMLRAYVTICGFFVIASMAVAVLNQIKVSDAMNDFSVTSFEYSSPYSRVFSVTYFLSMLMMLLCQASVALLGVTYMALYNEKGNQQPSVEEVWSYFKFYFFRIIGSAIVLGLCMIVAFICCIVPFFYVLPAFALVIPIIVIENSTMGFGISKGFELVKGNYWMSLGSILVMAIIIGVGVSLLTIPISLITFGSLMFTGHKISQVGLVLNVIAVHLCYVFYLLSTVTEVILYFSLMEKKEGTGLLQRINDLGKAETEREDETPEEL